MAQPPGVEGYGHPYRLVAPVLSFRQMERRGAKLGELRRLADSGGSNGYMWVPHPSPPPEEDGDEWVGHAVVCLFRMSLVEQSLLLPDRRVARFTEAAQRIFMSRLVQIVSPSLPKPDEGFLAPDMTSSWPC